MAVSLVCADPGSDVLAVFVARCASCHDGARVAKPKGKFGYILDLKKLAADRDRIVPGDPKASDLWLLVNSGNMPPNDSPTGPLSPAQKETIRSWIAAGAPEAQPGLVPGAAQPDGAAVPAQEEAQEDNPPVTGPSFLSRTAVFAGNFHLLVLHFPIVLIILAALVDVLGWWWRLDMMRLDADILAILAAVAAVPTVGLGWLHALDGSGASQPDNLFWHQWLGTGVLGLLAVTAWFCWADAGASTRRLGTTALILASALLTGLVAHFGGMMVHGRHFLTW